MVSLIFPAFVVVEDSIKHLTKPQNVSSQVYKPCQSRKGAWQCMAAWLTVFQGKNLYIKFSV